MTGLRVGLVLIAACAIHPLGVEAQTVPAEWTSRLTVRGRSYFRYSYETSGANRDFNEFNIDRVYVEFHARLWDKGRMRATLEGGDLRVGGTQALDVVTKHLYFEVQDPIGSNSYVRFGLVDLPWVPYSEDQWGYRLQGTVFSDRSGYLTSTDMGITAGGALGRAGSWGASLVNGEGWKRRETGRHKDVHGRITLTPFGGSSGPIRHLLLAGFGAAGAYDTAATGPRERRRLIVQAGYHHPGRLSVLAEGLWTRDPADRMRGRYPSLVARAGLESRGTGASVFVVANGSLVGASNRWALFGRWDRLDPDDRIAANGLDRYIGGIGLTWNESLMTIVDAEHVAYGSAAQAQNEARVLVQTQVRF